MTLKEFLQKQDKTKADQSGLLFQIELKIVFVAKVFNTSNSVVT